MFDLYAASVHVADGSYVLDLALFLPRPDNLEADFKPHRFTVLIGTLECF